MSEKFRVLLVEHSEQIVACSSIIKGIDAELDLVQTKAELVLGALEEKLSKNHYDLIITDAYFLDPGVSHFDGGTGDYLLPQIIDIVRKTDKNRIKIAVRTRFTNHVLKDDVSKHLLHVDYIWDKESLTDNYFEWLLKKVKLDVTKDYPEHALVGNLLKLLNENPKIPYGKEIEASLFAFEKWKGEVAKTDAVGTQLINIADKYNHGKDFKCLYEFIKTAEPFNVAANVKAWGHLRHVLNVFWLGYFILNAGKIDLEIIFDGIFGNSEYTCDNEEKKQVVNYIWFFSSIFHDVGLLLEKSIQIVDKSEELMSVYSSSDLTLSLKTSATIKEINEYIDIQFDKYVDLSGELNSCVRSVKRGMKKDGKVDHGLVSGMTLFKHFNRDTKGLSENEIIRNKVILKEVATIVSLHNLCKNTEEFNQASFGNELLSALLILCDQLQVWDRETGHENFSDNKIERYELNDIAWDEKENRFIVDINYIPYRSVSPGDEEMSHLEGVLKDFLQDNVKPIISMIEFKRTFGVGIKIKFLLDGRTVLFEWNF